LPDLGIIENVLKTLLRHDGWGIGLVRAPIATLLDGSIPSIEWLPLRAAHSFFADPFPIVERGKTYCFFEALSYRTNRGRIAYVALDEPAGSTLEIHEAIETPFHLSYPYLFRYDGEILCVPESFESGRITVYAARDFPSGWYERATLLEMPGVDPTIFQHEGAWWLLCTDGRHAPNAELHAFHADNPFGPWHAHAENPVKRGLLGTRPGGTPFLLDGKLYRPAQDCSLRYGGGLVLNEVLELTPRRFRERPVAALAPDASGRFPDGLHTASGYGGLTAVDGNQLHFDVFQAARVLRGYPRKLLSAVS
jgi:hypothetical protein